jgi:hypothetical protein
MSLQVRNAGATQRTAGIVHTQRITAASGAYVTAITTRSPARSTAPWPVC